MTIRLDNTDIERFRALVIQQFGLRFDDSKAEFLADILRERAARLGHSSADEYLRHLAPPSDGRAEFKALANLLTVPETYFYRNPDNFRALAGSVLPYFANARANQRRLRILSAGCASGEEAYTLAIVVRDHLPDIAAWTVRITGVDLNPANIAKAGKAHYSEWALRGAPDSMRERYFRRNGRDFVLDECIQKMVGFEERNLLNEDATFWQPDSFDVVFCRNVTMYFSTESMQAVIARIARSMSPGAYLFLGHAETLRGISNDFHLRHTHDTFYYQRKDASERVIEEPATTALPPAAPNTLPDVVKIVDVSTSWVDAIQHASERIAMLARNPSSAANAKTAALSSSAPQRRPSTPVRELSVALELLRQERFDEALEVLCRLPPASQSDTDVQLMRAVLLTNAAESDGSGSGLHAAA